MRRQLVPILPLLSAVAATRVLGSIVLPIYDDAFITFRYAKNLAETGHFVYNAGEWVLGTTTPLFGLLAALFFEIGLPMPETVLVLNIAIDVALAYLIYTFVSREYNVSAALLSVLFFSVSPIMIRICVGGMEANLFALVILGSVILYRQDRILSAIVLSSLSYFIRPEGALLAMFLIAHTATRQRLIVAVKLAAISLATVAPGLVVIYLSYGSIFSHSVTAKAGAHLSIPEVFRRLVIPEAAAVVFLVVAIIGIRQALRGGPGVIRMYLLFASFYLGAYLIMTPWIWSWYAMPIQLALVITAGISAAWLLGKFAFIQKPMWERYASWIGMFVVAGVWIAIYSMRGSSGVTRNIYGSLARSTAHLGGRQILAMDIGAVGYFSNAQIYDAVGLVTPEALQHRTAADAIRNSNADALFLYTSEETKHLMDSGFFAEKYRFERRFGPDGDPGLPQDTTEYIAGWQQDYLLFVKREQ